MKVDYSNPLQPTLFDLLPYTRHLVRFPETRTVVEGLRKLGPGGILLLTSPSRSGATSIIDCALEDSALGAHSRYTISIGEDTTSLSLMALGSHLGCIRNERKSDPMPRKVMIDAIVSTIIRVGIQVMVFEHLEFEDCEFQRLLVEIRDLVIAGGGKTRFIVHFAFTRKHNRRLAPELENALLFKIVLPVPDPVRVFSIFCLHLGDNCEAVRQAVESTPALALALEVLNLVVQRANGDLSVTVNVARRVSHYFGDMPVTPSFFLKVRDFIAEKETSPLYTPPTGRS